MPRFITLAILTTLAAATGRAGEPVTIENETLTVTVDAARPSFTVRSKTTGKTFVSGGSLSGGGGQAGAAVFDDPIFGQGRQITVAYPGGNRDWVRLFPRLPFVLLRNSLHNGTAEAAIVRQVRTLSAVLDLGKPAAELRAFGTGGLTTLEKNTGQLRVSGGGRSGRPARAWSAAGSRTIAAAAWCFRPSRTIRPGSTRRSTTAGCGSSPGQDAETETFALGWFDDARLGLEAYADAIAKVYAIKLPPQPAGYCTWYADKHGRGLRRRSTWPSWPRSPPRQLKPFGFEFVQIDDNWQAGVSKNGPKRNFTTHRARRPVSRRHEGHGRQDPAAWAARRASGSCPSPAPRLRSAVRRASGLVRQDGRRQAVRGRAGAAPAST